MRARKPVANESARPKAAHVRPTNFEHTLNMDVDRAAEFGVHVNRKALRRTNSSGVAHDADGVARVG